MDAVDDANEFFSNIWQYIRNLDDVDHQHSVLKFCYDNNFPHYDKYLTHYIKYSKNISNFSLREKYLKHLRLFAYSGTLTTNCFNFYVLENNRRINLIGGRNEILEMEDIIEKKIDEKRDFGKKCLTFVDYRESCSVLEFIQNQHNIEFYESVIVMSDASCQFNESYSNLIGLFSGETLSIRTDFLSHLNLKSRSKKNKFQFIDDFNLYRNSEEKGYSFMDKPKKISAIYTCPYNSNDFSDKKQFVEATSLKLEAVFRLAIQKEKECIVFQAFGKQFVRKEFLLIEKTFDVGDDKLFENEPTVMSEIFEKLLKKFTCYFSIICFSIPKESEFYWIFEDIFGTVDEPKSFSIEKCKYGSICRAFYDENHKKKYIHPSECKDLALCKQYDDKNHMQTFWHPPMCSNEPNCEINSEEHTSKNLHLKPCKFGFACNKINDKEHFDRFKHPKKCKFKGKCELVFKDDAHKKTYFHPPLCNYKGLCTLEFTADHQEEFCHPPLCKYKDKCKNNEPAHLFDYLHITAKCSFSYKCLLSTEAKSRNRHLREFSHVFKPICKHEPDCKSKGDAKHTSEFSHYCAFGSDCKILRDSGKDQNHLSEYAHINKKLCSDDKKCKLVQNDIEHGNQYLHSNYPAFKLPCKFGTLCKEYDDLPHNLLYEHPVKENVSTNVIGLNSFVDFEGNARNHIKSLDMYLANQKITPPDHSIIEHVRNMRATHRCKVAILSLIVDHGCLLSKKKQFFLATNPIEASVDEVRSDQGIAQLLATENLNFSHYFFEWTKAVLTTKLCIINPAKVKNKPLVDCQNHEKDLEKRMSKIMSDGLIAKIKVEINKKLEMALKFQFLGINDPNDAKYGTESQIFGIFGQHMINCYGDILFVFKKDILHHPDFDFCEGESVNIQQNIYHTSKLNCTYKGWEETVAKILCKMVHQLNGKKVISANDILELEYSGRFYFECHMPELIPLSYVKKIIIPQKHYKTLSAEQITRLNYLLRNKSNAIHVYDTAEDCGVVEKKCRFYLEPEQNTDRTGYSFSMSEKFGFDSFIPMKIEGSPSKISFEAKGFDIHISLSTCLAKTLNSFNKNYVHFVINERDSYKRKFKKGEHLENYSTLRHNFVYGEKNDPIEKINIIKHNANVEHYTGYVIKLKKANMNLCVSIKIDKEWMKKRGDDLKHTNKTFVEVPVSLGLKYISFSCWSKPIYIKNLRVL